MKVFRRAGRGDHLQIQKVMQQKKFCKDASWQEISLSRQSVSRQWPAVCAGPVAGRMRGCGHPRSMPCAGPETKNAEAPGASAKGISGAGDGPACRRGGHGPGRACCPRGGGPGGETHGAAAQACWAGPCAAVAAVAGDGAAVAGRHTRGHCHAHSLSPGRRARRAGSGPGHAGA